MSIIFTWSATNEGEGLKVIHFRNIKHFRKEINDFIRSMLAPHGTIAVAMNLQSRGKDPGAANLNMVNSSLKGLTPLPDLDENTTQLNESGFNKIKARRLIPASTFYGITASIA